MKKALAIKKSVYICRSNAVDFRKKGSLKRLPASMITHKRIDLSRVTKDSVTAEAVNKTEYKNFGKFEEKHLL